MWDGSYKFSPTNNNINGCIVKNPTKSRDFSGEKKQAAPIRCTEDISDSRTNGLKVKDRPINRVSNRQQR